MTAAAATAAMPYTAQISYPVPATQLISPTATSASKSCCESGRPIGTDPTTGQTVCSCQYSPSLLSYPRVAGLPEGVYGQAGYGATQAYVPIGSDPSTLYSSLTSGYGLKENGEAWRSVYQPVACYPYDSAMAAYPYAGYTAMDLNGARRKNATRESTSTLKAWLQEHIKNPYPTKGEKIMLAIITKMTLTQVSTWFANARRRLKKENKMTWSPRNRCDDDDDDDDDDGPRVDSDIDPSDDDGPKLLESDSRSSPIITVDKPDVIPSTSTTLTNHVIHSKPNQNTPSHSIHSRDSDVKTESKDANVNILDSNTPKKDDKKGSDVKPRIWSLAHTATSKSPPPGRRSPKIRPHYQLGMPSSFGQFSAGFPYLASVKYGGWALPYSMPYGIPQGHKQLPIIATPHVHPLDQLRVEKPESLPKDLSMDKSPESSRNKAIVINGDTSEHSSRWSKSEGSPRR